MLLVRLQTYDRKIEAMQKAGKTVDANNYKTRIEKMNQDLVAAFARSYNFSPVYFFYSRNSEAIKARNFKDILLDLTLKTIDLNQKAKDPFFIAEIAITESDTTKLFTFEEYQFKDSTGYERKKPIMKMTTLIISHC